MPNRDARGRWVSRFATPIRRSIDIGYAAASTTTTAAQTTATRTVPATETRTPPRDRCLNCGIKFQEGGELTKICFGEETFWREYCQRCYYNNIRICEICDKKEDASSVIYGASKFGKRRYTHRILPNKEDISIGIVSPYSVPVWTCTNCYKKESSEYATCCHCSQTMNRKHGVILNDEHRTNIARTYGLLTDNLLVSGKFILCRYCDESCTYVGDCKKCNKHFSYSRKDAVDSNILNHIKETIEQDNQYTYCLDCLTSKSGYSYYTRLLSSDLMFKCKRCEKDIDPIKSGGVCSSSEQLFCIPCYRKSRSEHQTHFSTFVFPKEERDRHLDYQTFPLKFFTDKDDKYAHIGVEVECESGLYLRKSEISERVNAVKSDGSISHWGMELLTQPSSGKEFVKTVDDVYGKLKSLGFCGSKSTGMHNHVDFANPTLPEVKKMFLLGYIMEPFIYTKIPKYRRTGSYSKPIHDLFKYDEVLRVSSHEADRLFYSPNYGISTAQKKKLTENINSAQLEREKRSHGNGMRYMGLNLHSIFFRGTVEFRYPHTVIDEKHAKSFGLFFASLVEFARSDKFSVLFCAKNGPDVISKAELGKPIDEVSDQKTKDDIYVRTAVNILKKIDTPSMKLLREINPDFLKA